jgi:hypothetical protein
LLRVVSFQMLAVWWLPVASSTTETAAKAVLVLVQPGMASRLRALTSWSHSNTLVALAPCYFGSSGGPVSSFLCILATEISVDVGAVRQTILTLGILKISKYFRRITKATLAYKGTPDLDVLVRQGPPNLKTPFEDFPISATFARANNQCFILDAQEAAAPTVKAFAKPGNVIGRQFASRVQAKLIKHPGEPRHPSDGLMSTARKSCHAEKRVRSS